MTAPLPARRAATGLVLAAADHDQARYDAVLADALASVDLEDLVAALVASHVATAAGLLDHTVGPDEADAVVRELAHRVALAHAAEDPGDTDAGASP